MRTPSITLEDLFNLKDAVLYEPDRIKSVTKITIDSRNVPRGSLFVAIKGEKFDGHDFVKDAVKKGSSTAMINKNKLASIKDVDVPMVAVKDSIKSLGELGAMWRSKLQTKIIGITGSAGKTTTKEMIFAMLNGNFTVNKTIGNNNNHIGVPLTLFSTTNKHEYLVLELGTNHFGEIKYTADISRPEFALITNIGNSHLEFLKNPRGVYKEKSALFESTISNDGILFINNDDPILKTAYKNYPKRVTFGLEGNADVTGEIIGFTNDKRPKIKITYRGKSSSYELPLWGIQNAKNFLAASAVALKLGLTYKDIKNAIPQIQSVDKRLNIVKLKDFILINDTYNANPDSMKMSLELLSHFSQYKNRIVVLGDMFELGNKSRALHEQLAVHIIKNRISAVYTIGKFMTYLFAKVKQQKVEAAHFLNREALKDFLSQKSFSDSVILVKGSRGMRMEEFAEVIQSK